MGPRDFHNGNQREVARAISVNRRNFLRSVTGAGAALAVFGARPGVLMGRPRVKKAVVVTFGGALATMRPSCPTGKRISRTCSTS